MTRSFHTDLIPEAKRADVARLIQEVFGVDDVDDMRPVTGGLSSARVLRIVVRGVPYLLRVMMSTDPRNDPARQFSCMKQAADIGVAPRMLYANANDRILVTDFVEAKPFPKASGPLIASVIRRLHSLPDFPRRWNHLDFVDQCMQRFRAAHILADNLTDEVFRRYGELTAVYPRDADLVASHNDLKPENVLFDGERFWLVDWEAANLNDRYFDLAVVANFFVRNEESEQIFLTTYLGEPPTPYMRARFYLMRQIMHMAYATVFMTLGTAAGGQLDSETESQDFEEFHDRLIVRAIDMMSPAARVEYGRIHFDRLRQTLSSPRFDRAIAEVSRASSASSSTTGH
jgi:aminoglycoside phosphotransferase (APT) family kinase protein